MTYKTIRGACGRLICKMSWETSTISLGVHMVACATPPPHNCWIDEFVPSLVLVQIKIKTCGYFLLANKFQGPYLMLELLPRICLSSSPSLSYAWIVINNMLVKSWIVNVLMPNYFLSYILDGWLIIFLICDYSCDPSILSQ